MQQINEIAVGDHKLIAAYDMGAGSVKIFAYLGLTPRARFEFPLRKTTAPETALLIVEAAEWLGGTDPLAAVCRLHDSVCPEGFQWKDMK